MKIEIESRPDEEQEALTIMARCGMCGHLSVLHDHDDRNVWCTIDDCLCESE